MEVECTMGSLMGRLVGINGRHDQEMPEECSGKEQVDMEDPRTVLVEIEAAINSTPLIQCDCNVLTPSCFLNGEPLMTLPTGVEPTVSKRPQKGGQGQGENLGRFPDVMGERVSSLLEELSQGSANPQNIDKVQGW